MAVLAAIFVRIVTNGVVTEATCARVTAGVVATASGATTITLLVTFDDTVATDFAGDGGDATIVGKAR